MRNGGVAYRNLLQIILMIDRSLNSPIVRSYSREVSTGYEYLYLLKVARNTIAPTSVENRETNYFISSTIANYYIIIG